MHKKNRYRLKFFFFLLFIIVLITVLMILENYRSHPDYAPMFSGIAAFPALYFLQQCKQEILGHLNNQKKPCSAINQD